MKLEEEIVSLLKKKHYIITTAESCTGGLLAGRILNVSGASEVFNEGYITYSNEAKVRLLGVKQNTLELFGAVSEQTASEMAIGAAKVAKSKVALSVTGIAGPDGGTVEKPVGLVFIGCAINGKVTVGEYHFIGTREENREASVNSCLEMLKEELLKTCS